MSVRVVATERVCDNDTCSTVIEPAERYFRHARLGADICQYCTSLVPNMVFGEDVSGHALMFVTNE